MFKNNNPSFSFFNECLFFFMRNTVLISISIYIFNRVKSSLFIYRSGLIKNIIGLIIHVNDSKLFALNYAFIFISLILR